MYININKELPPRLCKALTVFVKNIETYISTYDLLNFGVYNVSGTISELKKHGIIIEMRLSEAIDLQGNTHKRVAHYKLAGVYYD